MVDREDLCRQFDAAIDDLEAALRDCPDELWEASNAARCPPNHPNAGKTLRQLLAVNLAHVREHGGQMLDFLRRHSG